MQDSRSLKVANYERGGVVHLLMRLLLPTCCATCSQGSSPLGGTILEYFNLLAINFIFHRYSKIPYYD